MKDVEGGMFRAMVESAADPMFTCDAEGRYLYVNVAAAAVFGKQQHEIIGRSVDELFPPDKAEVYRANARRVIEQGATLITPADRFEIDGEVRWFNSLLQPLRDASGAVTCAQGIVRDVTDQKLAEAALRASNERLELAIHVADIGIFEHDHRTDRVYLSPEQRAITGIDPHTPVVHRIPGSDESVVVLGSMVHPDDAERVDAAIARAHDPLGNGYYNAEYRMVRPDGSIRWLVTRSQTFFDTESGSRRPVRTVGATRDVTDVKGAETALRESGERLQQAIQVASIGIFEYEHGVGFVFMSDQQRVINGLPADVDLLLSNDAPSASSVTLNQLLHPDDRERMLAAMAVAHDPRGNGYFDLEYRKVRPDGQVRWVATRAQTFFEGEGDQRRARRTVGASRDITDERRAAEERQALQGQLSQAQKMESIGRLAGGVAHDFNNMLNVILGWSSVALDELEAGDRLRDPLQEIRNAAERSAGLTRQLLAFARRQRVAPKIVDLNQRIADSLTMLQRLVGEDVQLIWIPTASLWPVRIDPSQIDQILANLVANARDAIREVGSVTLTTANVALGKWPGPPGLAAAPGDYVMLRVVDTGVGMDEETRAHVFEPFYTTKAPGLGTGLGLATVYGIVRQNDGAIHVESTVGRGTSIWIYLSRHVGPVAATEEARAGHEPKGQETILLVEDEPMMLQLSRTLLERLGYSVLAASTPALAVQLAAEHQGAIDLLFTDVVMPGMSGPDLAELLTTAKPGLRCLFASGHFPHTPRHAAIVRDAARFLAKPFTLAELAAKVREVLDAPA